MFDLQRGFVAAGTWFAVSYGLGMALGASQSVAVLAESAAVMGASELASDWLHSVAGMYPTGLSSAVGVGLSFAAGQALVRGDGAYLANATAGAANHAVSTYVEGMVYPAQYENNDVPGLVTTEEGAVSTD